MSKNPLPDPDVDEKLLSDIVCYEDIVRQYKFKEMRDIGLGEQDLIKKVNIYINDILAVVRARFVDDKVSEEKIVAWMGMYEFALCRVRDDKTPSPPLPRDNDEKDSGGVMGVMKNYIAPALGSGAAIIAIVKGGFYIAGAIKGSPKASPGLQQNADLDHAIEVIGDKGDDSD